MIFKIWVAICTVVFKSSFGHDLINRSFCWFCSHATFFFKIISSITWWSLEFSLPDSQLSLRPDLRVSCHLWLNVISCIRWWTLELSFREDLIDWQRCSLLSSSHSFVWEVCQILWLTFKFTTYFQLLLWPNLRVSTHLLLNIVSSICRASFKTSMRNHLVISVGYFFLLGGHLPFKLPDIWWTTIKGTTSDFQLSFWLEFFGSLGWVVEVITSIGTYILEFAFWKHFVILLDVFFCFLRCPFVVVVICIGWCSIELSSYFELSFRFSGFASVSLGSPCICASIVTAALKSSPWHDLVFFELNFLSLGSILFAVVIS